ncbi:MAG: LPS assembly protein LptD [Nitrospirae bacterium]|nr:LPS assembly protein LptD [Nitrospirota bacterium]
MRGTAVLRVLCALLCAGWMATTAHAFSLERADDGAAAPAEVRLEARSAHYDPALDRVTAEGDVRVTRLGTVLTVDRLIWEKTAGRIHGEGHVRVTDGANALEADAVSWDLNAATGEITRGTLTLEGRYYLSGDLISRVAPDRYTVAGGTFSSCPCRPSGARDWSVTARAIRLRAGGNLVARGVIFRVRDVPVAYLPAFVFPTSNRQTGLLIPSLGTDTRTGMRLVQPFYWAIDPSRDLTVAYNLRSRLGHGLDTEYRYMTAPRSQGEAVLNGIRDRTDGNLKGEARWRHATLSDTGWSWHADIRLVNDRNYFRDIGEAAEERTQESLESNLFASRRTSHAALAVLLRKTTDLADASGDTVQHLPRLRAEAFDRRVGRLPVWYGGHLDGVQMVRRQGVNATRLDVAPHLTARGGALGGRVTGTATAGLRWIGYQVDAADATTHARAYPFEATLSGRLLGRLAGAPHLLVPQLAYRRVRVAPASGVAFDQLERIGDEHEALLRLWQRWRDLNWRVTASYDLDGHGPLPPRSEVDTTLAGTLLHLDTLHDPDNGRLERAVADTAVVRSWGQVGVGALFDRGTTGIGTPFAPDTLLAQPDGRRRNFQSASLALGPWRGWHLTHRLYYDWGDGDLAEATYGIGYSGSCWSLTVNYVDLPDRNVVRFRLALIGPEPGAGLPGVDPHPLFGGA